MNHEEHALGEKRIAAVYTSQFRRHLEEIQAHLIGQDSEDLPPSFILPTGFWTSDEKNKFFHALGIYSRLRPDLIAACIGTKTVLEVCTYIDAIEHALNQETSGLLSRDDFEVSMEMSASWVDWEENQAATLIASESRWEQESLKNQIRAGGCGSRPSGGQTMASDTSDSPTTPNQQQWKAQEVILRRLDKDTLTVMERILNEAEDANSSSQNDLHRFPEGSSNNPSPIQTPVCASTESNNTDDAMITKPVEASCLDAPEGSSNGNPSISQEGIVSSRTSSPQPDGDGDLDLSQLSPRSRRKMQKRLYMRRQRAAKSGREVDTAVKKLRPGRKVAKRTKVSAHNSKHVHTDADIVDQAGEGEPEEDVVIEKPMKGKKHKSRGPGGMTKPYRIKSELLSNGVDARLLADNDLCLFHLSALGRLMGIYGNGYRRESPETASTISYETIQLLATIATDFVSDLIFRTINLHESHRRIKEGTLVYRLGEGEVNAVSVDRAKRLMGVQDHSIRRYFTQLLEESSIQDDDAAAEDEDANISSGEEDGSDDEYEDIPDPNEEQGQGDGPPTHQGASTSRKRKRRQSKSQPFGVDQPENYPIRLPFPRELHPPLVHLPKSLLSPAQEPAPSGHDEESQDLLLEMIDEDELARELQEEDELDSKDRRIALEYEVALWKEYCHDQPMSEQDLAGDDDGS